MGNTIKIEQEFIDLYMNWIITLPANEQLPALMKMKEDKGLGINERNFIEILEKMMEVEEDTEVQKFDSLETFYENWLQLPEEEQWSEMHEYINWLEENCQKDHEEWVAVIVLRELERDFCPNKYRFLEVLSQIVKAGRHHS
ncbi:hypothetical protein LX64_05203 [Chitinophaga skermanii]|uniref:Uncharacterized protein n=1 Tax=Chitinophaga skermanii TaxID=331697 RepID=A0A327PZR8_9BACT|nr:hypothetical protein [Chitinophaga skermanii]RAI96961.1 hypothetical protein LX64_05203 [Chitinophaga skermanii]